MKKVLVLVAASMALGGCMATIEPGGPTHVSYLVPTMNRTHRVHYAPHRAPAPPAPVRPVPIRPAPRYVANARPAPPARSAERHFSPAPRMGQPRRVW